MSVQTSLLLPIYFFSEKRDNKTGLQPVSRPVELVHYFGGWVEGPSKQTDRTGGGWVQSTFGAKAEQILLLMLMKCRILLMGNTVEMAGG